MKPFIMLSAALITSSVLAADITPVPYPKGYRQMMDAAESVVEGMAGLKMLP